MFRRWRVFPTVWEEWKMNYPTDRDFEDAHRNPVPPGEKLKSLKRPSFEEINMRLAWLISRRSTCKRLNVGCVIASPDFRKILAMGYNGNASGLPNQCDSNEPGKCGCFVSGTKVFPAMVSRAYRRWYEGEVVRVVTATGEFTATPRHPILASKRGWTPVELLRKDDELLGTLGGEGALASAPHDQHAVPIEYVFEALLVTGRVVRSAGARHEFHGDGLADENVDVVAAYSSLPAYAQASGSELVGEPRFATPLIVPPTLCRPRSVDELVRAVGHKTGFDQARAYHDDSDAVLACQCRSGLTRVICGNDALYGEVDHRRPLVVAQALGDGAKHATRSEPLLNSRVRNAEVFGDGENCLPAFVSAHKVVDVERYRWSGHVYNLETAENWYSIQPGGIIAHNCIHAEQNAVINCDSPRYVDKIIFTTHLPCVMCAKFMVNLGNVKKVIYNTDYRIRDGLDVLRAAGVEFDRYEVRW